MEETTKRQMRLAISQMELTLGFFGAMMCDHSLEEEERDVITRTMEDLEIACDRLRKMQEKAEARP